jgi:hypothetical protein
MNKSNRNVTQNNQNYRRSYQQQDANLRGVKDRGIYGRDIDDQNLYGRDRNSYHTGAYEGLDFESRTNYDRNPFNQNPDRNMRSSQRFNADRGYPYPATDRHAPNQRGAWQGNPSNDPSYGGSYLNWGSETGDSDGTRFMNQESHYGRGPKGYKRSDERIREDASEALTKDHHVDASEIEVSVFEGIITLSGSVPDRSMKRMAEDCVEGLDGVKDVKNNLILMPKLPPPSSGSSTNSESTKNRTQPKLQ